MDINFDNLVEATNGLSELGYTLDFKLQFDSIYCQEVGLCLMPDEFVIDKIWHFEDDSSADNLSVLYAISSKDGSRKGTIIDASGIYADAFSDEMLAKLKFRNT